MQPIGEYFVNHERPFHDRDRGRLCGRGSPVGIHSALQDNSDAIKNFQGGFR